MRTFYKFLRRYTQNHEINDVAEWMDIDKHDASFEFQDDDQLIRQQVFN